MKILHFSNSLVPLTGYNHYSITCIKTGKFGLKQQFFLTAYSYSGEENDMQQFFPLHREKMNQWPFSHLLTSIHGKSVGIKIKNCNWVWCGEEWQPPTPSCQEMEMCKTETKSCILSNTERWSPGELDWQSYALIKEYTYPTCHSSCKSRTKYLFQ